MKPSSRLAAILIAVFVTFLWSTSWVFIKLGLRGDLPAITFAGLRYFIAFLCLAPLVLFNPVQRARLRRLSRREWLLLTLLGVVFYTLAQGAQYVALAYLPAVVVNLLLNLCPILVGVISIFTLKEAPTRLQWLGVGLAGLGTGIYFLPFGLPGAAFIGLAVAILAMAANAVATLQGRQVNRDLALSPLLITFVSMGIGATLMLATGLIFQGLGHPTPLDWGFIVWMAVVNTAVGFTLWNHTQRTLTAVESSILNSLMMPQIAILAVVFLGEKISVKEILGLALVFAGVAVVQLKKSLPKPEKRIESLPTESEQQKRESSNR
jgi:drug/metabolite transporter (DMT)-like permease